MIVERSWATSVIATGDGRSSTERVGGVDGQWSSNLCGCGPFSAGVTVGSRAPPMAVPCAPRMMTPSAAKTRPEQCASICLQLLPRICREMLVFSRA